MTMMQRPPRLLLIEDSPARIEQFRQWVPESMVLVTVTSAGRAIGILLRRDPFDYAGIMLDHDLQQQIANPGELALSGTDVVNTLVTRISYEIPVLLHSISPAGVASMHRKLEAASFDVTAIPMTQLVHAQFKLWLSDVLELWNIREEIAREK